MIGIEKSSIKICREYQNYSESQRDKRYAEEESGEGKRTAKDEMMRDSKSTKRTKKKPNQM